MKIILRVITKCCTLPITLRSHLIALFLIVFSIRAEQHVPTSIDSLYLELCAVLACHLENESISIDDFSKTVIKCAPRAMKGLKWLKDKGEYSVYSEQIKQLLNELNLTNARYFTKEDKEYAPLCFLIESAPIWAKMKNQINPDSNNVPIAGEDIYRYAHKLSDGSILVLPPSKRDSVSPLESGKKYAKLIVHFFGSSTCGECHAIRTEILEPLAKKYPDKLDLRIHDIDDDEGFQLLDTMEKAYGVVESLPIQLFLPDTFLSGGENVKAHANELIERYIKQPHKWNYLNTVTASGSHIETLRDRFRKFTFLGILAAGLVDGINPCAIATLIFLISFLATQKRKRSEVLTIGLLFSATVFFTYLLLGLGAFKILTILESYVWISKSIKWLAVVVAGGLGIVSFYDAIAYAISHKSGSIKLQLPKAVKLRIHNVVSSNLTGSRLIIGAIVTGFLVTLLEAVCTGQVYLPTIVLMTKQNGLRLSGWLYLLFYNFLFVLPLLIIMILAWLGLTWKMLSNATQRHLPLLKVLLGIVLISLSVFLGIAI